MRRKFVVIKMCYFEEVNLETRPCEYCMFFWVFPRRKFVVCRRFGTMCQFHLQRLEVEYKLTPGKYPKEHIQYSNHGESLKSRIGFVSFHKILFFYCFA
jgi:hypothetical protein